MHWFPVYLAALLLTVPVASAQATSTANEAPLAEDPKGDVQGTPLGGPTQPVSGFEHVDLTGLWITEDPDAMHVKLQLAAMDGQPGADQPSTYTYFVFDGIEYRVWQGRSADNAAWFSTLQSASVGSTSFRFVAQLASRYDTDAQQVWTTIDRELLPGTSGRSFGRGDELTGIYAKAFAGAGYAATFNDPTLPVRGPLLDVTDRVPDADGLTLAIQYGGAEAIGGVGLTVEQPYRASNGAATTYLYDLEASNDGDSARQLRLEALHVPAGWNVSLPGAVLELAAGATVSFQLALTTLFFHEHGTSRSFHLRLADIADEAAWAQAELGVHYLAIPQPAGHHDTLYLHTHPWSAIAEHGNAPLGGTSGVLTMNTLQEDPEDAGVALTAYTGVAGNEFYGWAGCLDPGLAMGLDFDLSRDGTLRVPVSSIKPITGATLQGRILIVRGGDDMNYCFPSEYNKLDVIEAADIVETAPMQVGPNGNAVFDAVIRAKADRIDFEPGSHLIIELQVYGGAVGIGGTGGLKMEPGGSLQLPLNEYQDALPAFTSGSDAGEAPEGFSDGEPAKAQDTPSLGFALLACALLLLVMRRRAA